MGASSLLSASILVKQKLSSTESEDKGRHDHWKRDCAGDAV